VINYKIDYIKLIISFDGLITWLVLQTKKKEKEKEKENKNKKKIKENKFYNSFSY
jgi:hypothetical protein